MTGRPTDSQEALGLESGIVRLVKYDPSWQDMFQVEAVRLHEALGDRIGIVEHIGSTAIPGTAAKPIIDLMAAVSSLDEADAMISAVEVLGYTWGPRDMQDVPDRRYFARKTSDGKKTTHHLSLAEVSSRFWLRQVVFRDYLRNHREARDAYVKLKRRLAVEFLTDRGSYIEGKGPFVEEILRKAQTES